MNGWIKLHRLDKTIQKCYDINVVLGYKMNLNLCTRSPQPNTEDSFCVRGNYENTNRTH